MQRGKKSSLHLETARDRSPERKRGLTTVTQGQSRQATQRKKATGQQKEKGNQYEGKRGSLCRIRRWMTSERNQHGYAIGRTRRRIDQRQRGIIGTTKIPFGEIKTHQHAQQKEGDEFDPSKRHGGVVQASRTGKKDVLKSRHGDNNQQADYPRLVSALPEKAKIEAKKERGRRVLEILNNTSTSPPQKDFWGGGRGEKKAERKGLQCGKRELRHPHRIALTA